MELVEIKVGFRIDVGAPEPVLIASGGNTCVSFRIDDGGQAVEGWSAEPVVAVRFKHCLQNMFGMPGNETISGHPYYNLGLNSFAFYELRNSDLIGRLKKIDKIHPYHYPEKWAGYKHYILTFHDDMFECVARDFEIIEDGKLIYKQAAALLG